jgi:uncharacterized protein (TIGR00255 family)
VLLSMTGFGEARRQNETLALTVELKSVNNKHLKVSVRSPDSYLTLDHDLERLIRAAISRGTVYVNLFAERLGHAHGQSLDAEMLERFWHQATAVSESLSLPAPRDLSAFLALPDVVVGSRHHVVEEGDWPLIEETVQAALAAMDAFRKHEGEAMAAELGRLSGEIESALEAIAARAPDIVLEYRTKILTRVQSLLASNGGGTIQESDVLREVSLFADRCDVTEEITRLRCHLGQFRQQLLSPQSPGRKLDFLCQEMFREVNTIGSKANDVQVAHAVVEMKTHVEKLREIVQNIE